MRLSRTSVAAGSNVLSDALPGGADVRFTDSTGMVTLSHEIDTWTTDVLGTNAWIGKSNYNGDVYWSGAFDEARISRVARDSNWVRLDYRIQRSDSSAVSGTTLPVTAKALYYPQKTGSYFLGDSVVNAPVFSGGSGGWSISRPPFPRD